MKQKAKEGDIVTVVYDGSLSTGEVFESSSDTGPLEFVIGDDSVFASFSTGIIGMEIGETKTILVAPLEAFGPHNPELVQTISKEALGPEITPQQGMVLGMTVEQDGKTDKVPAMVTKIDGDELTIDYNHPLAGKELHYQVTLTAIDTTPLTGETTPDSCSKSGCSSCS
ncbi:MAG: peptidylprolyl isomerase [Proteobacteria bacterium]|nr:peptidylprolyl isomerase [Pseudomonadota bacterium]MBU1688255.1 peptidylprolyl isomerase [Pseudomonadota bacterium]